MLFQDVLRYQNGCPIPGSVQRPGWMGLCANTASDFTTRALSFQNAGFWPQLISNAFQDRTMALVTGENSCTCSFAAYFKWQKLTELIEILEQETRLQINNRNVELRKEYQPLDSNNSLRAQFPFYPNALTLSCAIFGNTWNESTTSSSIF